MVGQATPEEMERWRPGFERWAEQFIVCYTAEQLRREDGGYCTSTTQIRWEAYIAAKLSDRLTWSDEPPREAGWYWAITTECESTPELPIYPRILHVFHHSVNWMGRGGGMLWCGSGNARKSEHWFEDGFYFYDHNGWPSPADEQWRWSGPLPTPAEPQSSHDPEVRGSVSATPPDEGRS